MNSADDDAGKHRPVPIRRGPDRDQDAIDWHVWLRSGDASENDRTAFARWHADAGNAAAYAEIDVLWNGLGEALAPMAGVLPLRARRRFPWSPGPRVAAIAASVLALVGTGYQYLHVWRYDHVAQGANRIVAMLPDRSRVVLNTGAALDVDYAPGIRRVTLARGEAFFDVRHDDAAPFVVKAGNGEVRVLGTAFSVTRSDDGSDGRVVVLRGRVRVRSGTTSTDVTPDRRISFGRAGNGAVTPVDAVSALGWSRGQLFFRNMRLGDVIAQVDRYYPGVILLRDRQAADRRLSAVVRIDRIDEWLAGLGRTQRLTVRHYPLVTTLN